jgi:hypothetical protein
MGRAVGEMELQMDSGGEGSRVPLCFVIGPIGKEGGPERKHADLLLNAVIKHVLATDEFGYEVKRADQDADPGMITDRVISDIIHAELVVADSIESGRAQLARSARAIAEPDYRVTNPITQANASFLMRESADPRDRVIAELRERISSIETRLSEPRLEFRHVPDNRFDIDLLATVAELALQEKLSPTKIVNELQSEISKMGFDYYVRYRKTASGSVFTINYHEVMLFEIIVKDREGVIAVRHG